MENTNTMNNRSNKKEKMLKGAAYVGAAGAGSLGTMAFTTQGKAEDDAKGNSNEANDIDVKTNDAHVSHNYSQTVDNNNIITAELTDEQIAELKEDLRADLHDEIKQELLNDDGFIGEIKEEIFAQIVDQPFDGNQPDDHEIEVLDYATVTTPDGETADIATVKINDTQVAIIDVDQDDNADIAVVDSNSNYQIDSNDTIYDISDQGIDMHTMCSAVEPRNDENLSGDGELIENIDNTDFVNDADASEFLS